MSVRYTATWYDVTQARQQEHTPYTQTRTGPAGRSSGQCVCVCPCVWCMLSVARSQALLAVLARPALNRSGLLRIHTDTYRPGRQVFSSLLSLTSRSIAVTGSWEGQCMLV